ncbi:MAG: J domain-containing protein [Smithella sp.]|jgi:hypothetical protein
MLATQTTSLELFQACETIFGPEVKVSNDFLKYLQPIGIKTAYRKRAFETHPDRAKALGAFARDLNTEFIDVRQAYEKLLLFVETKGQDAHQHKAGHKKSHDTQRSTCKKRKSYPDHFYTGNVPKGNLMLGQFLYYSGLISWRTLIEAICWQRQQRPTIGQIAISWGLISSQDVMRILTARTFNEKFGECALRIGYISNFEHFALIGKQRQLQRPFGQYFIERGILTSTDIITIANKQQLHNLTAHKWKE